MTTNFVSYFFQEVSCFAVLRFIFRSMIHFELILKWDSRCVFFFFVHGVQLFQSHLLKKNILSPLNYFFILQKSVNYTCLEYISGLYSVPLIYGIPQYLGYCSYGLNLNFRWYWDLRLYYPLSFFPHYFSFFCFQVY